MFKIPILYCAVILLSLSCSNNKVKLKIFNHSSFVIDSIVLPNQPGEKFGLELKQADSVSYVVSLKPGSLKDEGSFLIYFYLKDRKFMRTWGFHDWGSISKKEERFYIFDHGVNTINEPLTRPYQFTLHILDDSEVPKDSIQTRAGGMILEKRGQYTRLISNYDSLVKNPYLKLYKNGIVIERKLPIDFTDWWKLEYFVTVLDSVVVKTSAGF